MLHGWHRFCDLKDGSFLAMELDEDARGRESSCFIAHVTEDVLARRTDARSVATSFTQFLQRALASEAEPYFAREAIGAFHVKR